MSAGAEHELPFSVAKRMALRVDGQRVRGGFLGRPTDVPPGIQPCGPIRADAIEQLLEPVAVFLGNGEVQPAGPVRPADVARRFDQVFFERRRHAGGVAMKRQAALGQVVVVQTVGVEQGVKQRPKVAAAGEHSGVLSARGERLLQPAKESEFFDFGDESDQRSGAPAPGLTAASNDLRPLLVAARAALVVQQFTEHARCRTGGGNELDEASGAGGLSVLGQQSVVLAGIDPADPVTRGAGPIEAGPQRRPAQHAQLSNRLALGNPSLGEGLPVGVIERRRIHAYGWPACRTRVDRKRSFLRVL